MNLIDKKVLIDAIESTDWYHLFNGKLSEGAEDEDHALYRATDIYKAIGEVPVMDAEPVRHGKWIGKSTGGEYFDCCSECGYVEWDAPNNYCPRCGAKMRGETE